MNFFKEIKKNKITPFILLLILNVLFVAILTIYYDKREDEIFNSVKDKIISLENEQIKNKQQIKDLNILLEQKEKTIKENQKVIDGISTDELVRRMEKKTTDWINENFEKLAKEKGLSDEKLKSLKEKATEGKKKIDDLFKKYLKLRKENPNFSFDDFMKIEENKKMTDM